MDLGRGLELLHELKVCLGLRSVLRDLRPSKVL